ncbi:MAG: hemerythrin family protein [Hydrogenothermaceae bacterium]|nr:hemerythrin family protein [Hydrogenothermaceae bacterium]
MDLDYIKGVYQEFIDDVVSHFSFKNQTMEEFNFFAYDIHRGEHDRILFQLKSIQKLLEDRGDVEMLKDYLIYTFKPWIISHIQSMDTVTATYFSNFI